jgi:hypothetical protein
MLLFLKRCAPQVVYNFDLLLTENTPSERVNKPTRNVVENNRCLF